jgi:hypothetical protein
MGERSSLEARDIAWARSARVTELAGSTAR